VLNLVRFATVLVLALGLLPTTSGAAFAQAACSFHGGFATLASQVPDHVGSCTDNENYRPDIGESIQHTTTGQFTWRALDGWTSFSDGTSTWVLDPSGQAQARPVDRRFTWESNLDGFLLVGQDAPNGLNGPCPTTPVKVLAVENFYGNLAQQIGGQCATVTTILSDPDADPHAFQPAASDVKAYQGAQLVIEDGLGYDDFSDKILATMSQRPALVRMGDVLGLETGANPHVWYSVGYVDTMTGAILSDLKQLNPGAASYYDNQFAFLQQAMGPYKSLIGQINAQYPNFAVGSTESIFVDMAYSLGANLISPPEFMNAIAEGNDPTARDVATFQDQIKNRKIKVLIYNTQTVTDLTEQLEQLARDNGVPSVGISETMPLGAQSFQGWQATQLQTLLNTLKSSG
jgi:zinc/manganese transport system substrate-binding protein